MVAPASLLRPVFFAPSCSSPNRLSDRGVLWGPLESLALLVFFSFSSDLGTKGSESNIPTLPFLSMRVCRADMLFGAAKRLACEGGSKSIDKKGSSSLAWLLEDEEEMGETGGAFWCLGGILGGGGERCVEELGM
jgi:hypothetical protein